MQSSCSVIISCTGNINLQPAHLDPNDFALDRITICDRTKNTVSIDAETLAFSLLFLAKLRNVEIKDYINKITNRLEPTETSNKE
jgi:hypothetical protein